MNPAICQLLGADDPSQLIGRSVFDIVHPDYHEEVRERWKQVGAGQSAPLFEEKFIRLDGTAVDVEVTAVAVDWKGARGVQVIARDVTQRKRAEEALRFERSLLRTLIDNIPDSIYSKDLLSRKTLANTAEIQHLRVHSEAEVLGKNDFDLYPKELADGFFADDQAVLQSGKPLLSREEYFFDEHGQKRWILTSKLPLRDKEGASSVWSESAATSPSADGMKKNFVNSPLPSSRTRHPLLSRISKGTSNTSTPSSRR